MNPKASFQRISFNNYLKIRENTMKICDLLQYVEN